MDVKWIGGEAARLMAGMHGNWVHARIEDTHQAWFPAHPHLLANVFGRHRIVGPGQFDVAVGVNRAAGFLESRKETRRQRQQFSLFHLLEKAADLLLGCAVNASIGHVLLLLG